eukprot:gene8777-1152_t
MSVTIGLSKGLDSVRWSPDGRHVLTTAQFQLRITIWSLVSQQTFYFKFPKHAGAGLSFSGSGKYMSILEREAGHDFISVVACDRWHVVHRFPIETLDACDLAWSPNDHYISIWDSPLTYKLCVYTISGLLLKSYSAYTDALGIKTMSWSPSSQLLALGSYDQKIRLLNNITWGETLEFRHTSNVTGTSSRIVYKEVRVNSVETASNNDFHASTKYKVCEGTVKFPVLKPDPEKPNPSIGVGWMAFSCDSSYLASRNDNFPNTLFIWHVPKLRLHAALLQLTSIRTAVWHPTRLLLALSCGESRIYFWSPGGTFALDVPLKGSFNSTHLSWSSSGDMLLVSGSKGFVTCCVAEFLSKNSSLV